REAPQEVENASHTAAEIQSGDQANLGLNRATIPAIAASSTSIPISAGTPVRRRLPICSTGVARLVVRVGSLIVATAPPTSPIRPGRRRGRRAGRGPPTTAA